MQAFVRNKIYNKKKTLIYHVGIIDFLQVWNKKKKLERIYKQKFKGADSNKVSAVPPRQYSKRFVDFMRT